MTGLHVAEGVYLPLELITSSNGILAKKGAGKTSAAVVLLEEMHQVGVPVIVVDPKGDWYGVRTSVDGDRPGLPIPVLCGRHGDVPLDSTAGVAEASGLEFDAVAPFGIRANGPELLEPLPQ